MSALIKQVLQDSPAWYGIMNETSGTTCYDYSGNGRNGTYTSAASGNYSTLLGTGNTITGSSRYVIVAAANTAWVNAITDTITYEAWFVPTVFSGYQTIWGRGYTSGSDAGIEMRLNGVSTIDINKAQTSAICSLNVSPNFSAVLYHIVYTKSGSTNALYINGVYQSISYTNATIQSPTARRTLIGYSESYDGSLFDPANTMCIQHAAMYGTALSADRVKAHYEAGIRGGVMLG